MNTPIQSVAQGLGQNQNCGFVSCSATHEPVIVG